MTTTKATTPMAKGDQNPLVEGTPLYGVTAMYVGIVPDEPDEPVVDVPDGPSLGVAVVVADPPWVTVNGAAPDTAFGSVTVTVYMPDATTGTVNGPLALVAPKIP